MMAGMVLTNLLYVVGAIVAATVVSGLVLLRHRRPRSLESSIEMFSRELRALQPERPGTRPVILNTSSHIPPDGIGRSADIGDPLGDSTGEKRDRFDRGVSTPSSRGTRAVVRLAAPEARDDVPGSRYAGPGSDAAGAPSPEQETEPG
jgi:hypothetical protein